ncbi:MAG: hypothetical protein AAF639_12585 [Chloroflexota bacterium]
MMNPETITLIAQIAPQRSTQYASLAATLAPYELMLSPLMNNTPPGVVDKDSGIEFVEYGKQPFLKFTPSLNTPITALFSEMATMATLTMFFYYYNAIIQSKGPFFKPIDLFFEPVFPWSLMSTRRYRGKTNELFTHFLCNIARYSSDFSTQPWSSLQLLDPLAGGGTTLMTGLVLGADVAGIELNHQDVQSTATFLRQFLQEARISHRVHEATLKKANLKKNIVKNTAKKTANQKPGHQWQFEIGKKQRKRRADNPLPKNQLHESNSPRLQHCTLSSGDTTDLKLLLPKSRPHLIVTDLPYGIQHQGQHQGQLITLLENALPIWTDVLQKGGVMVYSWDATRFPRDEMISVVQTVCPPSVLSVLNGPPYNTLAHPIDRVIKRRDVLVLKKISAT